MKLRDWKKTAVVAGLALAAASAAKASLIGDSVSGSLSSSAWGEVPQAFDPGTVTVGAGTEFSGQWRFAPWAPSTELWDIRVDIGASSVRVSANEITAAPNNLYAYNAMLFQIVLSGLDLGQPISALQLSSGVGSVPTPTGSLDVVRSAFTADSLTLSFYNLPFGSANNPPTGGEWVFDLNPAAQGGGTPPTTGQVPEPAGLPLAVLALAGAGLAGTRRRQR